MPSRNSSRKACSLALRATSTKTHPVAYPGGGSSAPVLVHSPYINDHGSTPRFVPVRRLGRDDSEVLLLVEESLSGLDLILGARGMTMIRESRRALQRGLYLASSSLLAAASEVRVV